jgi:DNA polymerase zeta
LKLDAEYYITRQLIPPLNRIFNLIGIDVKVWYDTMPKRNHASARFRHTLNGNGDGHDAPQSPHDWQGKTLDMHFLSVHCLVCGAKTDRQSAYACTPDSTDPLMIEIAAS